MRALNGKLAMRGIISTVGTRVAKSNKSNTTEKYVIHENKFKSIDPMLNWATCNVMGSWTLPKILYFKNNQNDERLY
jgi:hypothetical protein